MKIVSCFSRAEEIAPLRKAGADELYCAVKGLPSFGEPANLQGCTLGEAARRARRLGMKLSLAVNSIGESRFTPAGERVLLRRLREADGVGVDAFIISSPALLELAASLPRRRAALHLSSVQPCFNSLAAEFFIRAGVSRIIFPNQLAPAEAAPALALCRRRGVETEIFDYRFFGCAYVNGRCNLHRPDFYTLSGAVPNGSMCRLNASAGELEAPCAIDADPAWKPRLGPVVKRLSARLGCGGAPRMANMASFFDFFLAGVDFVKYGTRQDPSAVKIKKVAKVKEMVELASGLTAKYGRGAARRRFLAALQNWDGRSF